jgi:hypothetical protein
MKSARIAGAVVALLLCAPVPRALADHHFMRIVEVFPGTAALPNAQYVVLQMFSFGQNFVAGHEIRVFDANDTLLGEDAFAANLPNGASQAKILVATPDAVTLLGIAADLTLTTALPLAGGAVCFDNVDCFSWGSFDDGPGGASGAGMPFAPGTGLTQGQPAVCFLGAHGGPGLQAADCLDSLADHVCSTGKPQNNAGAAGTVTPNPPCPVCGNNATEGEEECDGTDDLACPGECQIDCTCLLDQPILGKLLLLKDPQPGVDPDRRSFTVMAKESASPNFLTGDPIASGASLTIDVAGTTPSSQTFTLPGGVFWTSIAGGFKYRDPTGLNGAIKILIVKRSSSGVFLIKATGSGANGAVDVVPANTASDATVTLTLGPTSDKYCTAFGGAAGGTVNPDSATQLKVRNATAEPISCP